MNNSQEGRRPAAGRARQQQQRQQQQQQQREQAALAKAGVPASQQRGRGAPALVRRRAKVAGALEEAQLQHRRRPARARSSQVGSRTDTIYVTDSKICILIE